MARPVNGASYSAAGADVESGAANGAVTTKADEEKALPLPGWLTKLYYIFPIILYLPDAIFNYYVYSDGITTQASSMLGQAFWSVVWGFVAIGVVGMAYLLSVLAPWHWSQNHRFQAFFCAVGVIIATVITTWNSLAFRSEHFVNFPTDTWANAVWPQLATYNFSLTMVLVSVAPPFWGLFWAIVQPTEKNRDLRHLQMSHAERVMKTQQEAELKRIRAEANAKVREAQLRGMAQTAVAAREQAAGFLAQRRGGQATLENADETPALEPGASESGENAGAQSSRYIAEETIIPAEQAPTPLFTPNPRRELAGAGRASREMYNHAAPTTGAARPAPLGSQAAAMAQPALLSDTISDTLGGADADVAASWPARPRPNVGAGIAAFFPSENDAMTGTTGPRPAIRRGADPSPLLRTMNDPHARTVEQVEMVINELKTSGIQPVQRDVVARLQERYNVDDATARKMANIYRTAKKEQRS